MTTHQNIIEKLISELCNKGVVYKNIGDVCNFRRGSIITKKDITEGNVPVIAGGQKPAYFHNIFNRDGETIAVSSSGAYAGFISFWNIPIFLSDSFSIDPDLDLLHVKYVYYFLKNFQTKIYSLKKGGGIPHIYGSDLAKFKIPIPPLSIQNEIVKILDNFIELETELEVELETRKKQYEYYRSELLIDNENIEKLSIESIFNFKNGYTPSKSKSKYWENGNVPWFRMEDIRENGNVLDKSIQFVNKSGIKGKGLFPENSIIVATSATIGEHALITIPHLTNQRFVSLSIKDKLKQKVNIKFLFYFFYLVDEWCLKNTTKSSFSSVDMKGFKKIKIPIPSIEEQERIVAILDKFDALVNDISIGLPAEIKARKQQYEYYRNKLLTFQELKK